jgi:hypothetical protein
MMNSLWVMVSCTTVVDDWLRPLEEVIGPLYALARVSAEKQAGLKYSVWRNSIKPAT